MGTTTGVVTDWGAAVMTSAAAALAMFLSAIPRIIGFLAIVIIGWIVASALAGVVAAILRSVKFNDLAQRSGFSGFVQKMGMHTDAAGAIATTVRWFVRLIVLIVAFDALGLPAVSQVLQQLLLWLPNLVVALVMLVITGLVANALSNVVRGAAAEGGLGNPNLLANVAKYAVWGFGIIVVVNQLEIATTLVNTLFMGFVAALALAVGLSFGLGARETAGEIVRNWYMRGQSAAPRMAQVAQATQDRMERARQEGSRAPTAYDETSQPAGVPNVRMTRND